MKPSAKANGMVLDKEGRLVVCGWSGRTVFRIEKDGSIIACGGSVGAAAGAMIYVYSAGGSLVDKQPAPAETPMRCAFGDADLGGLYLTTGEGQLLRARATGRTGARPRFSRAVTPA